MASLSRKIRRAETRKTRRRGGTLIPDKSMRMLQNFGAGVGGAFILLALPANSLAGDGFTQMTDGKTTTYNQTAPKVYNRVNTYNIGIDELHRYNQPSADAVFVQRVMGGEYSSILGQLIANGQVWIMNPGGVLIGSQATVNTAGFLATSLVMGEDDFFSGRYLLKQEGKEGFVINKGSIIVNNGGYAVLAGSSVVNNGYVQANLGEVVLASGRTMTMDFTGDRLIKFAVDEKTASKLVDPDGAELRAGVMNAGTINADAGRITLTARVAASVLENVVNNTGVIRARAAVEKNGEIILTSGDEGVVSSSGTLDVSGKELGTLGGTVKALGQYVGLFDQALVDASGYAGGGTVLIGGDLHGAGPEGNAFRTFVGKDATIRADALQIGDGGKVVVWSDDATRFYGSISARGGALSGNGGFAEVSGREALSFDGKIDLRSSFGNYGTLLLDPSNIFINGTGHTDGNSSVNDSQLGDKSWNPLTDYDVSDSAIALALSTANVTLAASNNVSVAAAAYIDPNSPSADNSRTLTLWADNNVVIGNAFELTNSSGATGPSLVIHGGNGILLGEKITTKGGSVSFNNNVTLTGTSQVDTTSGGNVSGNNIIFAGTINGPESLELTAGTGGVVVQNIIGTAFGDDANNLTGLMVTSGTADLNNVFTSGTQLVTAEGINLNGTTYASTGGSLVFAGATQLNTDVEVTSGAGESITFDGTVNGAQSLNLTAEGGSVRITDVVGTALGDEANNLTSLAVTAASADLNNVFTSGTQLVTAEGINLNGTTYASTGGSLVFAGATQLNTDVEVTSGVGESITFDGTVNGAQSLNLTAEGGSVRITDVVGTALGDEANNLTSLAVTAASADLNNVFTSGTQLVTADGINLNGTTYASTGGSLVFAGATQLNTDVEVTSGAGESITFDGTVNGAQSLNLTAEGGSVRITDVVGTALGDEANNLTSLAVTAASADLNNVFTSGTQLVTAEGINLNGTTYASTGGSLVFAGATQLNTDVEVTSGAGESITFDGTVNGAQSLNLTAEGGSVRITDVVGTALGDEANNLTGLMVTSGTADLNNVFTSGTQLVTAEGINLNGTTYASTGGSLVFAGATQLNTDVEVTSGAGESITFDGTVNGAQSLNLTAEGGSVRITDVVGTALGDEANNLTSLAVTAASADLNNVFTSGTQLVTAEGINLNGTTYASTGGSLVFAGATQLNTDVEVTSGAGESITFDGTVNGAQSLNLTAEGGSVRITDVAGTALGDEANNLTSLAVTAASADLNNVFTSGTQLVTAEGINLNGTTYASTGGSLVFAGATQLNTDVEVTSGAGESITFDGTVNGAQSLNLTAEGGSVRITDVAGTALGDEANNLTSLAVTAASADLNNVFTSGTQLVTAEGINLNGTTYASTGGSLVFAGATQLNTDVEVTSGAGESITFDGTVNGAQSLNLTAEGGSVRITDVVGTALGDEANNLTSLAVTAASADLNNVFTSGTQLVTADGINLNGTTYASTGGSLVFAGATQLNTDVEVTSGAGESITFDGTVNGAQSLNLTAEGGSVRITDVVGTALGDEANNLTSLAVTAASADLNNVFTSGTQLVTAEGINLNGTTYASTGGSLIYIGNSVAVGPIELIAGGSEATFTNLQVDTLAIAAENADVTVTTLAPNGTLYIGTVGETSGIDAYSLVLTETEGDISIDALVEVDTQATLAATLGSIRGAGTVASPALELIAGGAEVTLSDVQADTLAIAAENADVTVTTLAPNGTLHIGTVGETSGIDAYSLVLTETEGDISIDALVEVDTQATLAATLGSIRGAGTVASPALELIAGGAEVTLSDVQADTLAIAAENADVTVTTLAPEGTLHVGTVGETSGIDAYSLVLTETEGDISIDALVEVDTQVTLAATLGSIRGAGTVASPALELIAGGAEVTLSDVQADTLAIAAENADVTVTTLAPNGTLYIGTVGETSGIDAYSLVLTETEGDISIDALVEVDTQATLAATLGSIRGAGTVASPALELIAGGAEVTLSDVQADTLAIAAENADVTVTTLAPNGTLYIGTVGETSGIDAYSLVLTETEGDISIDALVEVDTQATLAATLGSIRGAGTVASPALELIAGGAEVTLSDVQADTLAIAAENADVTVTTLAPNGTLHIGTVGETSGIDAYSLVLTETEGDISIDALVEVDTQATLAATLGSIRGAGTVASPALELIAGGAEVTLSDVQADTLAIAAENADVTVTTLAPEGTLHVGTVGETSGIDAYSLVLTETEGDISIDALVEVDTQATLAATLGSIRGAGTVASPALELIAGGAEVTLSDVQADTLAIAAENADVTVTTLAPNGTLHIGTVGETSGIDAYSLVLTETEGDISIDALVEVDTQATLAATLGSIRGAGTVASPALELIAGGAEVTLSDVQADTLAIAAENADVTVTTLAPEGTLHVGTVGETSGIDAYSLVLTETEGDISIDALVEVDTQATLAATLGSIRGAGTVASPALELIAGGAEVTLSDVQADTLAIAAENADVTVTTLAPNGTLHIGTVGETSGIDAYSLVLTETEGDISIDALVEVDTQATLAATLGSIRGAGTVASPALELIAGGAEVTLSDVQADTLAIAAENADVTVTTLAPNGTLYIGTVGETSGIDAYSLVLTETEGDISIDALVEVDTQATLAATLGSIRGAGTVASPALELIAGGAEVTLSDVQADTLAIAAENADVTVTTLAPNGTLHIGTVGETSGIDAYSLVLTETEGDISIDALVEVDTQATLAATLGSIRGAGTVASPALELIAGGAEVTLSDVQADTLAIAAENADVTVTTLAPNGTLHVGTVGETSGIDAYSLVLTETEGDISIDALVEVDTQATLAATLGSIRGAGTVASPALELIAGGAEVTLSDVQADTLAIAAENADVTVTTLAPEGTLHVGTVGETSGIDAYSLVLTETEGDISIDALVEVDTQATLAATLGSIRGAGTVASPALELIAGGAEVTLSDVQADTLAIAAENADVTVTTLAPNGTLHIGTVGETSGIDAYSLVLTETEGDISIDALVEVDTQATLAATLGSIRGAGTVASPALELIAGGAEVTLSDVQADTLAIAAENADVTVTTLAPNGTLHIGTVGETSGIDAYSLVLTETEGDISIDALVEVDTQATLAATLGSITVGKSIEAASGGVSLNAGNTLIIGDEGDITAGGAVDLTAPGGIWTAGDITTTDSDILLNDAATLNGPVKLTAGTATVTLESTLAAGENALEIKADHLAFNGGNDSVSGDSFILLHPATDTTSIGIGDGAAGTLQLTDDILNALKDGFANIYIGTPSTGAHEIHINAVAFRDPVTIQAPATGGNIYVDGQITGSDNASIFLDGPGATTYLNADIVTAGNSITVSDNVIIGTADGVALDTTLEGADGADITIKGTVDDDAAGTSSLVLNGGTRGGVAITGEVGKTNSLVSFTLTAASADLNNVFTSGTQLVTADGINLNGTTYASTGGSILFAGATQLQNDVAVTSGVGEGVTFDGTVNGAQSLNLTAEGGSVRITDVVGTAFGDEANNLTSLMVTSGTADLNNVFTSGTQLVTAGAINLNGTTYASTGGSILFAGSTQLQNDVAVTSGTGGITFQGAVNGAQSLNLFADGGPVRITDAVGTGFGDEANNLTILTVSGASADLNSVFTSGTQSVTAGAINLNGTDYASTGGSILFTGSTQLQNDVAVTSGTGEGITFQGTVNGAQSLTLTAVGGPVRITDVVGTGFGDEANNLTSLTISAGTADLSDVFTSGTQLVTAGAINLNGTTYASTGGSILFAGSTQLQNDVAVTSGTGEGITFDGTVNGAQSLTLTAVGGPVRITDVVGTALSDGANNLTSLTISAGIADLSDVFTSGTQVVTAGAINLNGTTYASTDGSLIYIGNSVAVGPLELIAGGEEVTFTNLQVDTLAIAAENADVTVTALAPGGTLHIGQVGETSGITAASLTLTETEGDISVDEAVVVDTIATLAATLGSITGTAPVAVPALELIAGGEEVTLTNLQTDTVAVAAENAEVTLTTFAPGGTLQVGAVGDTAGITAASLSLTAQNDISLNNEVVTTSGAIYFNATNDITFTDAGALASTSGTITVIAGRDIALGGIDTGGTVNLEATGGSITDSNGNSNNVIAATLNAVAADSIGEVGNEGVLTTNNVLAGPFNALETAVSVLNVETTSAAGGTEIAVDNTLAGTLTPLVTMPSGNGNQVWIRNSRDLSIVTPLSGGTAGLNTRPDNNYGFIAKTGTLTMQNTAVNPLNIGPNASLNLQGGLAIVGLGGSATGIADVRAKDFVMKTGGSGGNVSFNTDVTNLDAGVTGSGRSLTVHQVNGAGSPGLVLTDLDGDRYSIRTNGGVIGIYQDNQDRNLTLAGSAALPGYLADAGGANITLQVNPVTGGAGGVLIGSDAANRFVTLTTDGNSSNNEGTLNITGRVRIFGTVLSTAGHNINLIGPSATITIDPGGFTGSGSLTLDPGNVPGGTAGVLVMNGASIVIHSAGADPGNLTVENASNFTMQPSSSITVDGGVTIQNIAGLTTLTDVNLGTGNFTLINAENSLLNGTLNANGHDVSIDLRPAGAFTGGALTMGTGGLIGNAGSLTIRTLDNIGTSAANINVNASRITLQTTGTNQPIFLTNTPGTGAPAASLTVATAGGSLNYTQNGGSLTTGSIITNGGTVVIDPPTDITVILPIDSGGADVAINATNDIAFAAGGNIRSGGGKILINADSDANGSGTVSFGVAGTAAGNNAIVSSDGGQVDALGERIVLKNYAIDGAAGVVTLTAGRAATSDGTITGQAGGGADITGGIINLNVTAKTAQTVIGAAGIGNGLDINPATLVNVTVNGATAVARSINIAGTGPLPIGTINTDAGNSGTRGDVMLAATGAVTDGNGALQNITARNLTIAGASTTTVQLGETTLDGALDVAAHGSITQNGHLTVAGVSAFNSNANAITLDGANLLTGAVSLTGTDVRLNNGTATNLGAVTATNLNITAGGNITDSGALSVAGTTSLTAGGNDITLDTADNDFIGAVNVISSGNFTLVDANSLVAGDMNAAHSATIRAAGSIFNDGIAGTRIAAPIANLTAAAGTIGVLNMPIEVDVTGTLFIYAGGMQNGVSANLQGRDINALQVDPRVPGIVLFNSVPPGAPLGNGVPAPGSNNAMSNNFREAIAQNTARLANEVEPYMLTLEVFGDAVFAPYPNLITIVGTGVSVESDEKRHE